MLSHCTGSLPAWDSLKLCAISGRAFMIENLHDAHVRAWVSNAAHTYAKKSLDDGFKPQALHTYTDADGSPLFWRIRLKHPRTGEKWIRPMSRVGGHFALSEPKFENGKPVYGLHHVVSNPTATVWIVEGEQKTDALAKLGLLATTSGGATSAEAADWTPLRDRTVCIWPDHDDPGKGYAGEVARILLDVGCVVSCVDVDKLGLGIGDDVIDWLAAYPGAVGHDVEALPRINAHPHGASAPAGDAHINEWPEPEPLTVKVEPEDYPFDALPDAIRAAVIEAQVFTKAPVPMVASSALAALSLAIQQFVDVKRAEKLTGPVGLFLLTIADSGERKSTCDGFFTKAIRDYEAQQAEAAKQIIRDYKAAIDAWEAERDGIISAIKQAGKTAKPVNGKDIKVLRAELAEHQHRQPETPKIPRLIYADATPEALAYAMAKQWPSGGVMSAEGGIVFGSHGMGKDSVMRNLAMLNQLWDGNSLTIDRRTSESFTVKGARLTVALQVQEPTLREFLIRSGTLARGSGFLARFLVAWPESTQGFRPFTEAPKNWPHLAAFNRRITAILDQPVPIDSDGALTPPMLTMTPEAKTAWVEYHNAIEGELASGGELYDVRDVASKSADNAARLAALFQMFEGAGSAVGLDCFESASRIAAWHLNEARRFFGELALPDELANAARLDSWLLEYCRRVRTHLVGKNHARQHGPLRDGVALNTAIGELADLDRVRLVKDGKRLTIHVNPKLLGFAAAVIDAGLDSKTA